MSWFVGIVIYFAIPLVATIISGRSYTWPGHLVFFLLWPIAWLFMGPEELP